LPPHEALQLLPSLSTLPGFGPEYCQQLHAPPAEPQTDWPVVVPPMQRLPIFTPLQQDTVLGVHAPALPVYAVHAACACAWLWLPCALQS